LRPLRKILTWRSEETACFLGICLSICQIEYFVHPVAKRCASSATASVSGRSTHAHEVSLSFALHARVLFPIAPCEIID
jgi:hypothetical protein